MPYIVVKLTLCTNPNDPASPPYQTFKHQNQKMRETLPLISLPYMHMMFIRPPTHPTGPGKFDQQGKSDFKCK